MKLRFTIPWKIGLGFGLFMMVVGIVFLVTRSTLLTSKDLNKQVKEVYTPSIQAIDELNQSVSYSRVLIKHWALTQSRSDEKERVELRQLMDQTIPVQRLLLDSISSQWTLDEMAVRDSLFREIDRLDIVYDQIRNSLSSFESYTDPIVQMSVQDQFLAGGNLEVINNEIDRHIDQLLNQQRNHLTAVTQEIDKLGDRLQLIVGNLAIFILIFGFLIAIAMSRSITRPIGDLKRTLLYLGKGIYPKKSMKVSNNEVGDMAFAVNRLTDGLVKTREFSNSVGKGDFSAHYSPLSDVDELGHALLKMRDDLA
ncbi:MAG: HAMP domain-containing protein [Flavobacteriales bacterium]|nr:HAMP domain-containing protein [Flavobacteriales bacterium]